MQDLTTQITLLTQQIAARASAARRPLVVALDGPSGAGKSSLARLLADGLDAQIVEGDDFFAGGVGLRAEAPADLCAVCIDWRAQRQVLAALLGRRAVTFHPFDWDRFDGSRTRAAKQLHPRAIIILEGVYANRPALRDMIDYAVMVDASKACRMRRLIAREGEIGPWEAQWHAAEDWYFRNLAPRSDFDHIICHDDGAGDEKTRRTC